jgi:hypothetical protein
MISPDVPASGFLLFGGVWLCLDERIQGRNGNHGSSAKLSCGNTMVFD